MNPLRILTAIALSAFILGCSKPPDPSALPETLVGKPLADAIKVYHLDACQRWDTPNMPPDANAEILFFMKSGDLTITYDNASPHVIKTARYSPSTETAEQRYKRVGAQWDDYVNAHTLPAKGKFGEQTNHP